MFNKFWQQRIKHGPKPAFEKAEDLLNAAQDYFEWCDCNPWMKVEQMRKPVVTRDAAGNETSNEIANLPTARPYSIDGLCLHLGVGANWFRTLKARENLTADFLEVIDLIETVIRTQKIEGATVGAFNANIVSRELGLVDKKELSGKLSVEQITGMRVFSDLDK